MCSHLLAQGAHALAVRLLETPLSFLTENPSSFQMTQLICCRKIRTWNQNRVCHRPRLGFPLTADGSRASLPGGTSPSGQWGQVLIKGRGGGGRPPGRVRDLGKGWAPGQQVGGLTMVTSSIGMWGLLSWWMNFSGNVGTVLLGRMGLR